ncbi:MAG TPA: phage holin family protein, partial [Abditibacteriaceae bacterium]|nr:phage holin family protein [Abditibacteriaceae bacterium]
RTALSAVALLVIANLSNGAISITNFGTALVVAVILGLANAVVKPILMAIAGSLTCVLSCLTLGLWSLVLSCLINGLIFFVAGQNVIPGFFVKSFVAALWAALALSVINSLATVLTRREPQRN